MTRITVDEDDFEALKSDFLALTEISDSMAGYLNWTRSRLEIINARIKALSQTGVARVALAAKKWSERPWQLFFEIHTLPGSTSYSSWFVGGLDVNGKKVNVGAAHSVEAWPEDRSLWPEWAQEYEPHEIWIRPAGLDIVFFGTPAPDWKVHDLQVGDRVIARGTPAGLTTLDYWEERVGTVYLERDDNGDGIPDSLIIQFDNGEESAVGGMSGGPVARLAEDGTETLAATLVTRNSPTDTDGDGVPEEGSDVVELLPALRHIRRAVAARATAVARAA